MGYNSRKSLPHGLEARSWNRGAGRGASAPDARPRVCPPAPRGSLPRRLCLSSSYEATSHGVRVHPNPVGRYLMGRLRFQVRPSRRSRGRGVRVSFRRRASTPAGRFCPQDGRRDGVCVAPRPRAVPREAAHLLAAHLLAAPPPGPARRACARPPRPCPRPAWSALVLAIPSGVWRRLVGVLIRFSRVACLRRDVACLSRASLPPLCARGGTVSAFARRLAGWLLLVLLTGSLLRITPPPDTHAQGARPVVAARGQSALPGENPSPPPRRQLPSTWTSRPEPSCVCSSRFCLFRGALLSRPWLSSGHSPTGATAELPGEGLPLEDPCRSGGEAGATVTAQGDIGLALPARALGPFAFLTVALGDPGGPCAICTWQARTWGVVLEASILGPCAHSSSHGLEARSPGL